MYSDSDLSSLYQFLKSTGEGHLRKMLVNGRMSEPYFRVMMKVVRGCSEADFVTSFQSGSFPKVNLKPDELGLRENFWTVCMDACSSVGLIQPTQKVA